MEECELSNQLFKILQAIPESRAQFQDTIVRLKRLQQRISVYAEALQLQMEG